MYFKVFDSRICPAYTLLCSVTAGQLSLVCAKHTQLYFTGAAAPLVILGGQTRRNRSCELEIKLRLSGANCWTIERLQTSFILFFQHQIIELAGLVDGLKFPFLYYCSLFYALQLRFAIHDHNRFSPGHGG